MEKIKQILNIIILGPQGSGKGTQAEILTDKYKLYRVETGKIFRRLSKQPSPLGRRVKLIYDRGSLIPDSIVFQVLELDLHKVKRGQGLIFDGFPRNLAQAKLLDKLFLSMKRDLTHVFYLPIPKNETVRRLALRRTCEKCNRIFILGKNVRSEKSPCPVCGGRIYQRPDDKPAAIARRLSVYWHKTKPVIDYYRRKKLLIEVDGKPPIPKVAKNLLKYLP